MTESLYQKACRLFPHKSNWTRQAVHVMRAKWIRAILVMGNKWIYHHDNYIKHRRDRVVV